MQAKTDNLLTAMAEGAVAGVVATSVMREVTRVFYERQAASAREREAAASGGKGPYSAAAEKAAQAFGARLSEEQRARLGSALHWAVGIAAGAFYGAVREQLGRKMDPRHGLLFGAAVWLLTDEVASYALGLSPGLRALPWQTHARGLAGRLAFGVVADSTIERLQHAA